MAAAFALLYMPRNQPSVVESLGGGRLEIVGGGAVVVAHRIGVHPQGLPVHRNERRRADCVFDVRGVRLRLGLSCGQPAYTHTHTHSLLQQLYSRLLYKRLESAEPPLPPHCPQNQRLGPLDLHAARA